VDNVTRKLSVGWLARSIRSACCAYRASPGVSL
jgi:hypothetical protein